MSKINILSKNITVIVPNVSRETWFRGQPIPMLTY
jgi:hypothetical protein